MGESFTAAETRRELVLRLSEAVTDDEGLAALINFLRNDLAYAPTNLAIVGAVLREDEFGPWKALMLKLEGPTEVVAAFDLEQVRDLCGKLLVQMELG